MTRTYWLDLFTIQTWEEFLAAGGTVSGFREGRWTTVQKLKVGDYLLCYLTGISRFIGVLEVTSAAFQDSSPIWKDQVFPSRVKVKPILTLSPSTAVPVMTLREKLSFFQNLKSPNAWSGNFRGSPAKWREEDGKIIFEAIENAVQNPIERPFNLAKLKKQPKPVETSTGIVTIPGDGGQEGKEESAPRAHTEIQSLLLQLGSDMGLDVWVARNDRSKVGDNFKGLRDELPIQFDAATNKTIELIDVLWLKRNAIVAAFEIESTTSIYSGLLRMADLISMQPNLNIPLYIVAPEERQPRVIQEVNRPTFSHLSVPMPEVCRFISFEDLRNWAQKVTGVSQYLKFEALDEIAESCEIEAL